MSIKKTADEEKRKVQLVPGEDCRISFNQVDETPPTVSGKYLYTISEASKAQRNQTD